MSLFVVISSPSGGGKDVIIKKLTEIFSASVRLITTTTRPPREGEKAGVNYNKIKHIAIFLLPDNLTVLKKRIRQRGGVSEADLKRRMGIARAEIKAAKNYDYRVGNKNGK